MLRNRKLRVICRCSHFKSIRLVVVHDLGGGLSGCSCDFLCTFAIDHDISLRHGEMSFRIFDIFCIWTIPFILRDPGNVSILYTCLCSAETGLYLRFPEAVMEHGSLPVLPFVFAVCRLDPVIQSDCVDVILIHDHTPRYKSPVFPRYR
nr:MAG TPA: hypothetical protein [Caudoviricetes sp.]